MADSTTDFTDDTDKESMDDAFPMQFTQFLVNEFFVDHSTSSIRAIGVIRGSFS